MESPNTSWEFNVEEAKRILEEAGWTMQGDVRAKDGVELNITFVTSINPVRQKEQAIIKQALDEIGFRTELRQVDAAVYFDSSPGNDQNINHFYNDLRDVHRQPHHADPDGVHDSAGMPVRRVRTSPRRRTNGPARTTAASRTPSTTSSSSRCGWRQTSRARRSCSSR